MNSNLQIGTNNIGSVGKFALAAEIVKSRYAYDDVVYGGKYPEQKEIIAQYPSLAQVLAQYPSLAQSLSLYTDSAPVDTGKVYYKTTNVFNYNDLDYIEAYFEVKQLDKTQFLLGGRNGYMSGEQDRFQIHIDSSRSLSFAIGTSHDNNSNFVKVCDISEGDNVYVKIDKSSIYSKVNGVSETHRSYTVPSVNCKTPYCLLGCLNQTVYTGYEGNVRLGYIRIKNKSNDLWVYPIGGNLVNVLTGDIFLPST